MTDVALSSQLTLKGRFYMALPALLLGASLVGWVVMTRLAVNDPGFAVEKDYYRKASHFDERKAAEAASQKLGWTVSALRLEALPSGQARVRMSLRDGQGAPLTGAHVTASAAAIARSASETSLTFRSTAPGEYEADLAPARRGLWEMKVSAQLGDARFVQTLRAELLPAGSEGRTST